LDTDLTSPFGAYQSLALEDQSPWAYYKSLALEVKVKGHGTVHKYEFKLSSPWAYQSLASKSSIANFVYESPEAFQSSALDFTKPVTACNLHKKFSNCFFDWWNFFKSSPLLEFYARLCLSLQKLFAFILQRNISLLNVRKKACN